MSRGKSLAVGSLFGLSSQATTFLIQFAYSAVTSRLINPAGFGEYGVALAASGLFAMFATAGIGQVAMLMPETSHRRVRALIGLALVSGFAWAGTMLVIALPWATLWGTPGAVPPTQFISLFVLAAPPCSVISGLARREGQYKLLAISTVSANVLAMAIGLICALSYQTSSSLVVSPVLTQILIPLIIQIATRKFYLPIFNWRVFREVTPFIRKVFVFGTLAYVGRNMPRLAVSRTLGPDVYGNWNRSDVLTSMPLQTIESAIVQVVYPEFRHDAHDTRRAYANWSNMILFIAWVSIPTSILVGVTAPHLIPLLFGPGWEVAAQIAPGLAIASGLQMPGTILSSGLQATDNQRQTWISEIAVVLLVAAAVIPLVILENIWYAMAAVIIAPIVRHSLDIRYANRVGLLDTRLLLRGYATVALVGAFLACFWYYTMEYLFAGVSPMYIRIVVVVIIVSALLFTIWRGREKLTPVKIARQYAIAGRARNPRDEPNDEDMP